MWEELEKKLLWSFFDPNPFGKRRWKQLYEAGRESLPNTPLISCWTGYYLSVQWHDGVLRMKNNQEDYKCLQYITVQGLSLRGHDWRVETCMRGSRSLCNDDSLTTIYRYFRSHARSFSANRDTLLIWKCCCWVPRSHQPKRCVCRLWCDSL